MEILLTKIFQDNNYEIVNSDIEPGYTSLHSMGLQRGFCIDKDQCILDHILLLKIPIHALSHTDSIPPHF